MLATMTDAFSDAVNDARRRLDEREGRHVSTRELARRADYPFSSMGFHLGKNRTHESRRVPGKLIEALARVLPISEADLARAAQESAGITVRESGDELPDLRGTLVRYLRETPDKAAQMRTIAEVQRIMAEEMGRILAENNDQGEGRDH